MSIFTWPTSISSGKSGTKSTCIHTHTNHGTIPTGWSIWVHTGLHVCETTPSSNKSSRQALKLGSAQHAIHSLVSARMIECLHVHWPYHTSLVHISHCLVPIVVPHLWNTRFDIQNCCVQSSSVPHAGELLDLTKKLAKLPSLITIHNIALFK